MSPYTSVWTGATPGNGPSEFHLVLVDNGRTRALADPVGRQALRCIHCAACLNVCPVRIDIPRLLVNLRGRVVDKHRGVRPEPVAMVAAACAMSSPRRFRRAMVVLDSGTAQGRRALSLVPDHLVLVVREDQLVGGVPEAVARLAPTAAQTWVSGPSATSDIELQRVEGVHGPRVLDALVLRSSGPGR